MTSRRRFDRPRTAYVAPAWAGEQIVGGPGPKAVLLLLANYADENYSCYPSQDRIARETEQSVRTVRRQIELLEELGLVRRQKRYDDRGKRTSDRFYLDISLVVDVTAPDEEGGGPEIALSANLSGSESCPETPVTTGQPEPTTGHSEHLLPDTGVRVTPRELPEEPPFFLSQIADAIPDPESGAGAQEPVSGADEAIDPKNDREDVARICEHLRTRIIENGYKPVPNITQEWRRDARLMLDKDEHTEQQIHWMIEWATNNDFWRPNIRSVAKLRKHFSAMRDRVKAEYAKREQAVAPRRGDIDWSAAMERAEQMDAQLGAGAIR